MALGAHSEAMGESSVGIGYQAKVHTGELSRSHSHSLGASLLIVCVCVCVGISMFYYYYYYYYYLRFNHHVV